MLLEPWTWVVKVTSSGKCSKGRSTQGERYLRATKLPQRHMERGKHLGVCLCEHICSSGYVTLVERKGKDLSVID